MRRPVNLGSAGQHRLPQRSGAKASALDSAVFVEQIRLLSDKRFDVVGNSVAAVIATAMFWRLLPAWLSVSWLAVFALLMFGRGALLVHDLAFPPTAETAMRYARILTLTVFATAVLWGLSGSVVLVTQNPAYEVLIVMVLGGMMSGGCISSAIYLPAMRAFVVPTILPVIVFLLTRQNALELEMGVILALFATLLSFVGIKISRTLVESLRLRFEQATLIIDLRASEVSMAEAQRLAHVGGLKFDLVTDTVSLTAETYRIVGVDPATFAPSYANLLARVHVEDRPVVEETLANFARTGLSRDIEYRIVMDDGTIRYMRSSGRKLAGSTEGDALLFASIQDVTEQANTAHELDYRARLLRAVTAGTAILLRAESIASGMPEALRTLGESMSVDRINVMQEFTTQVEGSDPVAAIALRYTWQSPDIPPGLEAPPFSAFPAAPAVMLAVHAQLARGEAVIGQIAAGEGPLQPMLLRTKTKSALLVPIIVDRAMWGNLSADACRAAREWTATEIDTLKTFASIVGSLIVSNEARFALETSETRFRSLSATAQDAIITIDGAGLIQHWNRSAERILGYGAAEAIGRPVHQFMAPARFKEKADRGLDTFLATGKGPLLGKTVELAALKKDGTEVIVEVSLAGARIGDDWEAIGILRDVSSRKLAEAKLLFANMLLNTEMEASPDGILVVDADRKIISVNLRFMTMWGLSPADRDSLDEATALAAVVTSVSDPQAFVARVTYLYEHPGESGDEEISLLDGRFVDRRTASLATPANEFLGRVWYFRDITSRKKAESLALRMARYDVLTGLANRSVFVEAIAQAIVQAQRGGRGFAVIYLDLDHFKDVNDTLGHPVGDELLQATAARLRSSIRTGDTIARFGGDEFAVVVSNVGGPSDAATLSETIIKALAEPFTLQGNEIRSSVSIGIDLYGPGAGDAETLLSHADVALYRAKADGRSKYRFFTPEMDKEVRNRVRLGTELRTAIATGQLFLLYQPQVAVETGRVIGLEALVRWQHPERGVLGPMAFIPVAESTGLIVSLGQWVLQTACRQAKSWMDAGITPVRIAVNFSGLQFKTPLELEGNIAETLAQTGLPARLLEIELTETVLMDVSLEHSLALARLRRKGMTIAIDDFGTGYSSLGYLRQFPVDRIKIAQDFVRDLATAPGQAAIAKATIGLARDLGVAVIAEGVETREQLEALKAWGCTEIQGYYFAKPLSIEDVTRLMQSGGILTGHAYVETGAA
jgi:diguanylate cyclase (GGDEF)-like protein/PAS domain S-box-containing protein